MLAHPHLARKLRPWVVAFALISFISSAQQASAGLLRSCTAKLTTTVAVAFTLSASLASESIRDAHPKTDIALTSAANHYIDQADVLMKQVLKARDQAKYPNPMSFNDDDEYTRVEIQITHHALGPDLLQKLITLRGRMAEDIFAKVKYASTQIDEKGRPAFSIMTEQGAISADVWRDLISEFEDLNRFADLPSQSSTTAPDFLKAQLEHYKNRVSAFKQRNQTTHGFNSMKLDAYDIDRERSSLSQELGLIDPEHKYPEWKAKRELDQDIYPLIDPLVHDRSAEQISLFDRDFVLNRLAWSMLLPAYLGVSRTLLPELMNLKRNRKTLISATRFNVYLRALRLKTEDLHGKSILDVASGKSNFADKGNERLSSKGTRISTFDRIAIDHSHPNTRHIVGDVFEIERSVTDQYDLVVSNYFLEGLSFDDQFAAIQNMLKVVRPGGELRLSYSTLYSLFRLRPKLRKFLSESPGIASFEVSPNGIFGNTVIVKLKP